MFEAVFNLKIVRTLKYLRFAQLDISRCSHICNSYTMATRDLPDIYALPKARGRRHIYQVNSKWPWYKPYIPHQYTHQNVAKVRRDHTISFKKRI